MSPRSTLPYAALLLACFAAGNSLVPDDHALFEPRELSSVTFDTALPREGESAVAVLDPAARATLQENLDFLKKYPDIPFLLHGFTDDRECSGATCDALGRRRAQGIHDWLIANGVKPSSLQGVVSHGERDAIDYDETAAGRARNRRVEFDRQPRHE